MSEKNISASGRSEDPNLFNDPNLTPGLAETAGHLDWLLGCPPCFLGACRLHGARAEQCFSTRQPVAEGR